MLREDAHGFGQEFGAASADPNPARKTRERVLTNNRFRKIDSIYCQVSKCYNKIQYKYCFLRGGKYEWIVRP